MLKRQFAYFLFFGFTVLLFAYFGRSIYMPLLHQLRGGQTVAATVERLHPSARERLQPDLERLNFADLPDTVLIAAFKEERRLEVYVRTAMGFQLLKTYPFTAYSGQLGPKLQEGDRQIPEGIYEIEYLNPNSSYHLSLKVSYPNDFDLAKSRFNDSTLLGGDIFIHGKAVTIGCIPIGDAGIEELFLLAENALSNTIKVIISPRDFRTNPEFPNIKAVDWERELYQHISAELIKL